MGKWDEEVSGWFLSVLKFFIRVLEKELSWLLILLMVL
jgi:hypothetical protein